MRAGILLALLFSTVASAGETEKFVDVGGGQKLFVRHEEARAGAETLVLLNGLSYSTAQWGAFAQSLRRLDPNIGILRYDMKGMGRTLLNDPLPVHYAIPMSDQVDQLNRLLTKLKLDRVTLVGLSYGGGIALGFATAHPEKVSRLLLMAPFTEALADQDQYILGQVRATRLLNPFNPATDEELYDFFLRQFIYSVYPVAEPVVLENPFKLEAIFRMVQGIRFFRADAIVKDLPSASVHLMVAGRDQYIPREVLDRFWEALPPAARGSRLDISLTEHKIPEAVPNFAAAWVLETLSNPLIGGGRVFEGRAQDFRVRSGKDVIELPRP